MTTVRDDSALRASAPPWASGIVTGLESAVLSAGIVVALAFLAVASAPSPDGSIAADWSGGWDVAVAVWLLAHGVPATVGGVAVTLVPLGLGLVSLAISASVARRLAVATRGAVLCAGIVYGALVSVVAAAEGVGGPGSLRAGFVGATICAVGSGLGLRARGFRFWAGARPPAVVASGVRIGLGSAAAIAGVGALLATAWSIASWGDVSRSVDDLSPDLGGGMALAVAETAYVPTVAVWAAAWIAGPGFTLGGDSHYATDGVVPGRAPALPLLEVLPDSGGGPSLLPLVVVALGAAARIAARRSLPRGASGYLSQVLAIGVCGLAWWGLGVAASGAVGGGSLATVGVDPLALARTIAALAGAGMLAASFVSDAVDAAVSRPPVRPATTRPSVPTPRPRTPEDSDPLRLW